MASSEAGSEAADAALKKLEAGIELFHGDRVAEARTEFEAVIAGGAVGRLTSRARDYLAACDRAEAAKDGKGNDAFLEAVMARNDGDLEGALKICTAGSRTRGRPLRLPRVLYPRAAGRIGAGARFAGEGGGAGSDEPGARLSRHGLRFPQRRRALPEPRP